MKDLIFATHTHTHKIYVCINGKALSKKRSMNHMDEKNPPRVSRNKGKGDATTHHEGNSRGINGPTTITTTTKNKRFTTVDDGGGEFIGCSGKYCKSCTAGLIADCVALCCCPCAVLHCFALAFAKAPWVGGRRCLGLGNKNKNKKKGGGSKKKGGVDVDVVLERNNNRKERGDLKMGWRDSSSATMESVTFEAEKVWLELYQIGHLDFGRVSFSGD